MVGKSIMWKYIEEESKALTHLMQSKSLEHFVKSRGSAIEAVYLVAHGSSYNAAHTVSNFLSKYGNVRVYVYTPANFCYNASSFEKEDPGKTLVLVISQTGTSSGAIEALHFAQKRNFYTAGITSDALSPIGKESSACLSLCCGNETSNAKTKGYSATLLILLLFSVHLAEVRNVIDESLKSAIIKELSKQISIFPALQSMTKDFCQEVNFGHGMRDLYILGYGMNYGTAMEGQLKLMETMCIPTMFNDIGEFSHGMHRAISKESTVLILNSGNILGELAEKTYTYIKQITDNAYMIDGSEKNHTCSREGNRICIPGYPITQSVLLFTLIIQILSVFAPESLDLDPNRISNDSLTTYIRTRVQENES